MKKIFILFALAAFAGCTKSELTEKQAGTIEAEMVAEAKKPSSSAITQINFTQPNLFPEGVVYDKFNDRFYVSSTTRGDIGIVSADGSYTVFIDDPALTSTTGLEIDDARKLLYVSNAPGTVGVYDTRTGSRLHLVNLAALLPGAPIFINDIALDPQGNAYVTNSLTPVIYKITPDGTASIFFQNTAFALPPGGFGFNGIEYGNSGGGYLLVAFTAGNQIIKIPVNDTESYSIVSLNALLNRPDGLLLSKDGKQLIVVNNAGGGEGKVLSFMSNNKWESGTLSSSFSTGPVFPTTATTNGKEVFVLYAYLNKRSVGQNVFTIQEVPLNDTRPF
jgi:sugar lactone lactonase YvrE